MLGLGNTLTKSFHEQMYSLTLDGTGDYLATSSAFQSTFRGSFSISFWIKPDDGQPSSAQNLLGSDNNADEDAFFISLTTAGKIQIDHEANNDPASFITDSAVFADGASGWRHICVTVLKDTNTTYTIFADGRKSGGTLTNAVAEAAHEAWTSTDNLYIGALNDDGTATAPFTGKIDDVALFDVVLDDGAVSTINDLGPFDLSLDRGNYDNASDLVAYWRMFNGILDDKVNGLVLDQTNPTFGSDLISNGGFDDDTGWTTDGTVWDITGGKLVFVGSNTGGTANQSVTITGGKIYKITYECSDITATGSHSFRIVKSGGLNIFPAVPVSEGYNEHVAIAANDSAGTIRVRGYNPGDAFSMDNLTIQLVNGSPGLAAADATYSTDTADD